MAAAYMVLKQTPRARNQLKRVGKNNWTMTVIIFFIYMTRMAYILAVVDWVESLWGLPGDFPVSRWASPPLHPRANSGSRQ